MLKTKSEESKHTERIKSTCTVALAIFCPGQISTMAMSMQRL